MRDIFSKISDVILVFINTQSNTYEPDYYSPKFQIKDTPGTVHISILTENNEAVSLTSTINTAFGSKIM